MFDRETKRPRGFGFVTFMSEDAVERVLDNYENNFISGKWVECKKATPKDIGCMDRAQSYPVLGNLKQYMMYPYSNSSVYDTCSLNTYDQSISENYVKNIQQTAVLKKK